MRLSSLTRPNSPHGTARQRFVSLFLLLALLTAQLAALGAPQTALAAPSADASVELVYLDPGGTIRVYDPSVPADHPQVQWFSPTGNWRYLALGDVNGDGDKEIIALGKEGEFLKLAVFDPVVFSGATDPNKRINGIPWDILYEVQFPAEPLFVIAGNFDPGIAADEIAIGYADGFGRRYVQILNANSLGQDNKPTGRDWKIHIQKDYSERYTSATAGDLLNNGIDEIILIANSASPDGYYSVFIPNEDMRRLYDYTASNSDIRGIAAGQIIPGGRGELAVGRTGIRTTSNTLFVMGLDSNLERRTEYGGPFSPAPQYVFLADISGNGDKEVFFIRFLSDNRARMVMIDEWGDDRTRHPTIELQLDSDNGYTVGVGGDTDGDGKDEVIIMRNNNIRIYNRPDNTLSDVTNYAPPFGTDSKTLLAGDLDRNGFIEGPTFGVDKIKIEANVPTGTLSTAYTFQVTNLTTPDNVGFNIIPGAFWVLPSVSFATTPAVISVQFNATNLAQGVYRSTITLTSSQNVTNQPFIIEVELNVLPADIRPLSPSVGFAHPAGTWPPTAPITRTLGIRGTNDLNYTAVVIPAPQEASAAIVGGEIDEAGNVILHEASGRTRTIPATGVSLAEANNVEWLIDPAVTWLTTARSNVAKVPSEITLVADPTPLGDNFPAQHALLILVADSRAGSPPQNIRAVPLSLIYADTRLSLPTLVR